MAVWSMVRIGTQQGPGPSYLGPRVSSDQALQHQGVALPDGVDPLADVIFLHHTGLPRMHDLGLGWSCGEKAEEDREDSQGSGASAASECVWGESPV